MNVSRAFLKLIFVTASGRKNAEHIGRAYRNSPRIAILHCGGVRLKHGSLFRNSGVAGWFTPAPATTAQTTESLAVSISTI